jgi:hypothetical protein
MTEALISCRCWRNRGAAVATMMIVLLSATGGCAYRARAQAAYMWQLRGAVVAVHNSSVTVRDKSGQVVALTVDGGTAFVTHHQPASRDQLKTEARVLVDVLRSGGLDRAVLVHVF